MKRLFKSVVATTATAAMVASMGASAFANAEFQGMDFVGFDTTDAQNGNIYRIYNEIIDGKFTGKQILDPISKVHGVDFEWKFDGFEAAYPHAGYDRLYLREPDSVGGEWKVQNIYRYNNIYPQWDIRRNDFEWEVIRPHYVWERRQTKINNETWTYDYGMEYAEGNWKFQVPDSELKTKTAKTALNVEYDYVNYGFGAYDNEGIAIVEDEHEVAMYKAFTRNIDGETAAVKELTANKTIEEMAIDAWNNLLPGQRSNNIAWGAVDTYKEFKKLEGVKSEKAIAAEKAWINADKYALLSWDALSARNDADFGRYIITDEMIQALIPVVKSEIITAQINATTPAEEKDVAAICHNSLIAGETWAWDLNKTFKVNYDAEIDWTAPKYQITEPYRQYQFLIVNGVVCDGSFVEIPVEGGHPWEKKLVQKPYVGRYTDGNYAADVEWKFYMYGVEEVVNDLGEVEYVYPVYEQKFIDGEAAVVDGQFVLRRPNGRYGTPYIVDYGARIEYRLCEGVKGVNDLQFIPAEGTDSVYKYRGNVGGYVNNFGAGPADVEVNEIGADKHPQLIVDEKRTFANEEEVKEVAAQLVADLESLDAEMADKVAEKQIYQAAKAQAEVDGYKEFLEIAPEDAASKMSSEEYVANYVEAHIEEYVSAHIEAHADAYKAYLEYHHNTNIDDKDDYQIFKIDWINNNIQKYYDKHVCAEILR